MKNWYYYRRLLFNRATLSRVLSEIELERIRTSFLSRLQVSKVLVAGGGKRSRGSEAILLTGRDGTVSYVFLDIDKAKKPDLITDVAMLWPFREAVFDLVISTWVVEHLVAPHVFFQEAFHVLQKGGLLVLIAPFIYRKHGSPYDYWRYTDTALLHLARSSGFRQVEARSVGGTPCLACLSLLWPFLRLPFVGLLLFGLAWMLDRLVVTFSRVTGKGRDLVGSYPISYIVCAGK